MFYLLLMTLAGTILYLLYFVWARIFRNHVSDNMRYVALIVVLLVHIMPLTALKSQYSKWFEPFLRQRTTQGNDLLMGMAEVSTASEAYVTPDYRWMMLVAVVWIGFSGLLLLWRCLDYFRTRYDLKKVADVCRSESGIKILERLQKEYHIRRRVEVLQVDSKESPYTFGVFKPVIVLTREFKDDELEWILRHELTHILRGDVAFALLAELVCCLYWFNLTLYWFKNHFADVCEKSCDARVIRNCTEEDCDAYGKVLIKCACEKHEMGMSSAMANEKKKVHERIKKLMNSRKMKRWEKIIAVSAFVVFMLVDSMVALAYPNVYHVEDEVDSAEGIVPGDSFWIYEMSENGYGVSIFEVLYDVEFIDENGTITPINLNQPLVYCPGHDWIQGYVQTHLKNDDGSCTVKTYNSRRCPYCNTVIVESLYATINYVKCPH